MSRVSLGESRNVEEIDSIVQSLTKWPCGLVHAGNPHGELSNESCIGGTTEAR
jgi:hypothetical protein